MSAGVRTGPLSRPKRDQWLGVVDTAEGGLLVHEEDACLGRVVAAAGGDV
jgi:hypothetical protein